MAGEERVRVDGLLGRLGRESSGVAETGPLGSWDADENSQDQVAQIVTELQQKVLNAHRALLQAARRDQGARDKLYRLVGAMLAEGRYSVAGVEREELARRVGGDLLGYGPVTEMLSDDSVTEIMVNGPEEIWVERDGELVRTVHRFRDAHHLRDVLERIFAPTGRRIDLAHPWADGRLPDGSRAHAILPPLAVSGPYLTIRKFNHRIFKLSQLEALNTLSPEMAGFLRRAVEERRNILVAGASGTGKTTLLNALSREIPARERVVSIEDAAELRLQHPHWLHLEARLANPDGTGAVPMRELVRNALRMRPDRIIIGEVRGREAFDLLSALTTGHTGALATVHASSPEHALTRMVHLVQMAETGIPHDVVREQVCDVVDLAVQMARVPGGGRRITAVAQVSVGATPVRHLFRHGSGGFVRCDET